MVDEKQQPIVEVYDFVKETKEAIDSVKKETKEAIDSVKKQQKTINFAMYAVVLVVVLGFIGIIIATFPIFLDHQDYAAQKYNEYIELIKKQNDVPLDINKTKN